VIDNLGVGEVLLLVAVVAGIVLSFRGLVRSQVRKKLRSARRQRQHDRSVG
jgi:hypothetical protein